LKSYTSSANNFFRKSY